MNFKYDLTFFSILTIGIALICEKDGKWNLQTITYNTLTNTLIVIESNQVYSIPMNPLQISELFNSERLLMVDDQEEVIVPVSLSKWLTDIDPVGLKHFYILNMNNFETIHNIIFHNGTNIILFKRPGTAANNIVNRNDSVRETDADKIDYSEVTFRNEQYIIQYNNYNKTKTNENGRQSGKRVIFKPLQSIENLPSQLNGKINLNSEYYFLIRDVDRTKLYAISSLDAKKNEQFYDIFDDEDDDYLHDVPYGFAIDDYIYLFSVRLKRVFILNRTKKFEYTVHHKHWKYFFCCYRNQSNMPSDYAMTLYDYNKLESIKKVRNKYGILILLALPFGCISILYVIYIIKKQFRTNSSDMNNHTNHSTFDETECDASSNDSF